MEAMRVSKTNLFMTRLYSLVIISWSFPVGGLRFNRGLWSLLVFGAFLSSSLRKKKKKKEVGWRYYFSIFLIAPCLPCSLSWRYFLAIFLVALSVSLSHFTFSVFFSRVLSLYSWNFLTFSLANKVFSLCLSTK